jgi:tRNA A-37 threonylcarbamoyl transferase component Bud32/CheY-like chemotaxis protein
MQGVHNRIIMADRTDDPRIGQTIAGYRIEERVGRGGMGVVYRAEHLNLRRRAAIKIIAPDLAESEGFRERFTREARIAAALQHPNIVTVYDAGEVDGILYLAMQYIEGNDLAAMLRKDGRLRPYRAIDVIRQVASALDAAHAMGLIHRDVKPANVLIEGRTAFLTDFGLTKRMDGTHTELTRAGDVVGTIHYVAPEQIEGGKVSARSDVYSLGCLLYHCLTGQVPYSRDTDVAVIYAHLSEPPPKLTALRPELAAGLDGVIAKALDKSPDRRFPTCTDLVNAARGVIDAAGPLDTSAPRTARESSVLGQEDDRAVGEAIEGMRDAAAAARRPRVLLGGVDANTRAVARMALGDRVDVIEADQAGGLVERAREERPDLVILDYAGAGLSAGSAVGSLRDDALTRDAKVLLLVDFAQAGDREVTSAGADERLAMPFSPLQLQVKLRKLLGPEAVSG